MNYKSLLRSPTKDKWQKIGVKRRSGVAVPLFSIYSSESIGIGEIPDLKLLIDWCKESGTSILQLLPLNEVGFDFSPYNSISTFALEPMYLRLSELKNIDINLFRDNLKKLKRKFKNTGQRVNYEIKNAKIELLRKIYKSAQTENKADLNQFVSDNNYWIKDYALYKVIKENSLNVDWQNWNKSFSEHNSKALDEFENEFSEVIRFQYWLQWQLFEQMKDVKNYAMENEVLIMGDLPFLVSRDSADVWAHQNYFQLNYSSGAPPDMYFSLGQKWGSPPYNWKNIEKDNYTYICGRLRYAENFYDMYRIDHFVGLFRLWTVKASPLPSLYEPFGSKSRWPKGREKDIGALKGKFEPENKNDWESHGKKIIDVMLKSSTMLPCAEDLGTVPKCSYKTLREYGIPGIDFQRFFKNKRDYRFVKPGNFRKNSCAVISTHDSSFFVNWWNYEAGTVDEKLFELQCRQSGLNDKKSRQLEKMLFDPNRSNYGRIYCKENLIKTKKILKSFGIGKKGIKKLLSIYGEANNEKKKFIKYLKGSGTTTKVNHKLVKKCFERINESASIFSVQLLHEMMYLEKNLFGKINKWSYRINQPGIMDSKNWTLKIPLSLEGLISSKTGSKIVKMVKKINSKTKRS